MVLTSQNAFDILGLPSGEETSSDIISITARYKQLAIKWHPEKHKYSTESAQKFKQVSQAYHRLSSPDFHQDLNMNDCLSLFQQTVCNRAANSDIMYNESDSSYDSDSSDDNQLSHNNLHRKDISSGVEKPETGSKHITEEETERRRAEKRRAKKKRQREKKRLEKEQKLNGSGNSKKDNKRSQDQHMTAVTKQYSSSEEDTLFDPTSAFFTKVLSKKKQNGPGGDQPQIESKEKYVVENNEEAEEMFDPYANRSRELAIEGNKMALAGEYADAIQKFSQAISLDQTDFRYFGNRSYCYDRIEQYDKALRDAEKAIILDKDWPKGYFRKGRALAGLKMFAEAEKAFMQVLVLDKNSDDSVLELLRVRTHQLMDMGFSPSQSEEAIKKYDSVQAALDSLLAGVADDEDEGFSVYRPVPVANVPLVSHATDTKMDSTNPEGLTALWVGNVLPTVPEKRLTQLFSKFGQVSSVRLLPEKYCAFINFKTKEGAGRAMAQLQGADVDGLKLVIKFPDNPLSSNSGNLTIRKDMANGVTKLGHIHKKVVS